MATLRDISKATGISVTQVSRALGGHDDVHEETRRLVESAALDLGYRPNRAARSLKTGRSGLVAMVVPSNVNEYAKSQMFEMVTGVSSEVSKHGLKFMLHVCPENEDVTDAHMNLYLDGGIDGFIIILPRHEDPTIKRLSQAKIPFVVHGWDPSLPHPGVDIDNFAVARQLTLSLFEKGHKRVLFLNGPDGLLFAQQRTRGALDAALGGAAGNTVDILYGEMHADRGYAEAYDALSRVDRPSAIVAGNAMLAKGVYAAAADLGLRIPQDLSVLAHDDGLEDFDLSTLAPRIGRSRSPLKDAWVILARKLKTLIDDSATSAGITELDVVFEEGESVSASWQKAG